MTGIIVKAKVKEYAKGMNVSTDFYDKLDEEVRAIIARAVERARANKRTTVMGKDV